jgi:hypothetical protein
MGITTELVPWGIETEGADTTTAAEVEETNAPTVTATRDETKRNQFRLAILSTPHFPQN